MFDQLLAVPQINVAKDGIHAVFKDGTVLLFQNGMDHIVSRPLNDQGQVAWEFPVEMVNTQLHALLTHYSRQLGLAKRLEGMSWGGHSLADILLEQVQQMLNTVSDGMAVLSD